MWSWIDRRILLACAGQLARPFLLSTAFHTSLLVCIGLMAARVERPSADPFSYAAVWIPSELGSGGQLDGSDLTPSGIAQDPAGSPLPLPSVQVASAEDSAINAAAWQHAPPGDFLEVALAAAAPNAQEMLGTMGASRGSFVGPQETAIVSDPKNAVLEGNATGDPKAVPKGNGGPGRGGSGGSSFFGLQSYGEKVVFVVDVSGSMRGRRIRRARNELRHTLEALRPSQQFYIVFFSDDALPMPADKLLPASPENLSYGWQWLKQVEAGGGTNPLPAMMLALELKPDSIYLLTDGKFAPQVVWEVAQAQPAQRIPIYTIAFASRRSEKLLKAMSDDTGGTYRFVP